MEVNSIENVRTKRRSLSESEAIDVHIGMSVTSQVEDSMDSRCEELLSPALSYVNTGSQQIQIDENGHQRIEDLGMHQKQHVEAIGDVSRQEASVSCVLESRASRSFRASHGQPGNTSSFGDDLLSPTYSDANVQLMTRLLELETREMDRRKDFASLASKLAALEKRMESVQTGVVEQLDALLTKKEETTAGMEFLHKAREEHIQARLDFQKERDEQIQSRLDMLEASALEASGLLGTGPNGPPSEFMQEMMSSLALLETKYGDLQSIVDINTSSMAQTAKRQDVDHFKLSTQTLEKKLHSIQSKLEVLDDRVNALSEGAAACNQQPQIQQGIPKLSLSRCAASVASTPPASTLLATATGTPQLSLSAIPLDVRALSGERSRSVDGVSNSRAATPQRSLSSVPNEVNSSRSLPTRALSAVPFPRASSPSQVCRSDKALVALATVPTASGVESEKPLGASLSVPTLSAAPTVSPNIQNSWRVLQPVTERLPITQRSPANQHRPLRSRSPGAAPGPSQVSSERLAVPMKGQGPLGLLPTAAPMTSGWQVPLHIAPTAVAFGAVPPTRKTSPAPMRHSLNAHLQFQAPTQSKAMAFATKAEVGMRFPGLVKPNVAPARGGA